MAVNTNDKMAKPFLEKDEPLRQIVQGNPISTFVLDNGEKRDHDAVVKEAVQLVRKHIGPVASFKKAAVVEKLPKTRSGKILRGTIQKMAECKNFKIPATIDDPDALECIADALKNLGYGSRENSKLIQLKQKKPVDPEILESDVMQAASNFSLAGFAQ